MQYRLPHLLLATGLAVASTADAIPTPSNDLVPQDRPRERTRSGGDFGLGVVVGDQFLLSGKVFFTPAHALQFGLGTDLWGVYAFFRVHIDYVWHPGVFARDPAFDFMPDVGIGMGFGVGSSWGWGYPCLHEAKKTCGKDPSNGVSPFLRAPLFGLTFHRKKVPVDTFFEFAFQPGLAIREGRPPSF